MMVNPRGNSKQRPPNSAMDRLKKYLIGSEKLVRSPIRTVVFLAILVFLVELLIMNVLHRTPWISEPTAALIDSFVLVLLMIPGFYFLLFRPMLAGIETERVLDAALRESEEQFRAIYEQSPIAIELYDSDGQLVEANRACLDLFGVDHAAEVNGFKLFEDPNISEDAKKQLQKGEAVQYESVFDFDLVKKLGLYKTSKSGKYFIDARITPLRVENGKKNGGYLVQVQDITERKQAEEALHNIAVSFSAVSGEEFFNKVSDYLADKLNIDCAFIGELVEEDTVRVVGGIGKGDILRPFEYDLKNTPCENVMGQSLCWYPSGVQKLFPEDLLLVEMGIDGYLGIPLFNSIGKAIGIIVLLNERPITNQTIAESTLRIFSDRISAEIERKQAEEALRQSEENFRALAENAIDGILITDLSGNYVFANQRAADISGYSISELLKKSLKDLSPPEDYTEIRKRMKERLQGKNVSKQYEAILIRHDGAPIPIEITAATTNWQGEPADLVIVRDITERKRAEEALHRHNQELTTLLEVSKTLVSTLNMETVWSAPLTDGPPSEA